MEERCMYTNTGSHSFCKRQSEENTHSMFEGQQLIENTSKWPDITAWKFWNWLKIESIFVIIIISWTVKLTLVILAQYPLTTVLGKYRLTFYYCKVCFHRFLGTNNMVYQYRCGQAPWCWKRNKLGIIENQAQLNCEVTIGQTQVWKY